MITERITKLIKVAIELLFKVNYTTNITLQMNKKQLNFREDSYSTF